MAIRRRPTRRRTAAATACRLSRLRGTLRGSSASRQPPASSSGRCRSQAGRRGRTPERRCHRTGRWQDRPERRGAAVGTQKRRPSGTPARPSRGDERVRDARAQSEPVSSSTETSGRTNGCGASRRTRIFLAVSYQLSAVSSQPSDVSSPQSGVSSPQSARDLPAKAGSHNRSSYAVFVASAFPPPFVASAFPPPS